MPTWTFSDAFLLLRMLSFAFIVSKAFYMREKKRGFVAAYVDSLTARKRRARKDIQNETH